MSAFNLCVNYGMKFKTAVILGDYDWVNPDITPNRFPTNQTEKNAILKAELIHFNKFLENDDVIKKLGKMGYRPAEFRELLAFGQKYPKVQNNFPVAAIGTIWHDQNKFPYAAYLHSYDSERYLGMYWLVNAWRDFHRFLAIRK